MDLFFYGTLLDPQVFEAISGQAYDATEKVSAERAGYVCTGIVGQAYPMLVPDPNAAVEGLIFQNLTGEAVERIRFYEGFEYDLVDINLTSNREHTQAKAFEGAQTNISNGKPWSLENWCHEYKPITLEICNRMMPKYGKMDFEQFNTEWDALEAELGIWEV